MNFSRFLCDDTPSDGVGNNTAPNRPSFQVHAGRLEDETRQGRCSDASERSHCSVDSHTNMHQNESFFIGSRAVMERKLSQKKRFFRQNAITAYTSSTEKNAQNNMTWTGQSIKKSATWFKGIRASNPVKRLFTWKASSIAPVRSGRGSSRGYAEVFEHSNVSRDSLLPR
ncbi:hypothetical protein CJF32_00000933 [Rutstroemia sp. NJR-2017a WRK4]|nr:hypothetical protein CJF32_00000933 [Rutstroemia sp. NJR-2017a WRK4]